MPGSDRQTDGEILERSKQETKKPELYKVLLLNDDYTTMDFVVEVLESIFHKQPAEAFRIIEGLGPEWEVIGTLQEVMGLLRSAAWGELRYVALDPPSALRRGHEEPRLVPIKAFVDHLMGK